MLISEKKRGQNRINNRSGGQEWVKSLFRAVKREDVWHKLIKYQTYVKFLTHRGPDAEEY